jgi:hypothetical protein
MARTVRNLAVTALLELPDDSHYSTLQERGMALFAPIFSNAAAEAIRAFVARQANLTAQ